MAEDMKKLILTKETEVTSAIEATHQQLAEVKDKLEALQLARQDEGKTEVQPSRLPIPFLDFRNQPKLTFPAQPETPPQPFALIPFCRDPDFVNREDIVDQIHQRCSEPAARVALVGLGGVGYAFIRPYPQTC